MDKAGASSFRDFIKKFAKHRLAAAGFVILLIEILLVIVLPVLLHLDPFSLNEPSAPPGRAHILGTDEVGRDLFARVVDGGRVSLFVGIMSALISVAIGLPLGLIAGYRGGWIGSIIMRGADIFMSFPSMVLILVLVAIVGPSIATVTIVIGVLGWTNPAKLIYGNVLSVQNKEYVEAARAIGTRNSVILWKYILPNSVAPLWMSIAFRTSSAIITESSLSFLGAGVQTPQASWGNIIYSAQNFLNMTMRPWMWLPAGCCLLVTVVCINLVGEGLRDALDPKMRR
jgi:peptide/nickel transport system permease protein